MMIEVLIVDDHPATRMGLRLLLDSAKDFSVVGDAECGIKALELVSILMPDILLLDYLLPDIVGSQVTAEVRKRNQKTRVLGYSGFSNENYIIEMLDAGAHGYVLKTELPNLLFDAIRIVARGGTWLSPTIAKRVLDRSRRELLNHCLLSRRELEVLKLLAKGYSNTQIAKCLVISSATVKNHLSSIYSTLAVGSRAEAITWAWSNGLLARELSEAREENIGQSTHSK